MAAHDPARWLDAAARRQQQQRALDALGDRELGDPGSRSDGARRRRARRPLRRARPGRPRSPSSAGRATTAATDWSRPGCCASRAAMSTSCCWRAPTSYGATRAPTSSGSPAPPPAPFTASALDGPPGSSTRSSAPGSRASRGSRRPARSRRSTRRATSGAVVIACDVPSGVDALDRRGRRARPSAPTPPHVSRRQAGPVDRAGQEPRRRAPGGRYRHPGRARPAQPRLGLIDAAVLDAIPRRGRESTKFAAGSVLVCGGSPGLTGAPCAGLRGGDAGGRRVRDRLVPASLNLVFEPRLLEVMSVPLPDNGGALRPTASTQMLERCERADALVLGPGLGRADATRRARPRAGARGRRSARCSTPTG